MKVDRAFSLFLDKENCCGCSACMSICPAEAISMKPDKEGFVYPVIDTDKCINCARCLTVCSFHEDLNNTNGIKYSLNQNKVPYSYAVKHKDEFVREESRSGGVFTALTDWILNHGGTVYGCILDADFYAVHVRADSALERNRMRGSKYIQSDISNSFKCVVQDLRDMKIVCFTGTSCQIAALQGFLSKALRRDESYLQDNLYCIDILCHGVPSPKILHSYIEYLEKRYYSKCVSIDFRDKKHFGWKAHVEAFRMKGILFPWTYYGDVFKRLFYGHYILRPSCYVCPYKSIYHPGDVTIGDYWGIDKAAPDFNDNKGTSLVLLNNDKARAWFKAIEEQIDIKQTDLENSMQPALQHPFPRPKDRNTFWEQFYKEGIDEILKEYVHDIGIKKVRNRIKIFLMRMGWR